MKGNIFVDTNVFIYAHDADAGGKHSIAADILRDLWQTRAGIMSTQVFQEFYVNVTRKIPTPIPRSDARDIISQYSVWNIVGIDTSRIVTASQIEERHKISFWDALIVAAAQFAGAQRILTEDLKHGDIIGGVLIENPFRPL